MSEPDARPFRRGDVVELLGVVVDVDPFAQKVLVNLGRDAGTSWVPVRRLRMVAGVEDWTDH